jgi:formate/nitrite transporter
MSEGGPETLNVIPPARIAQLVEQVGVTKVALPAYKMLILAFLAGVFIAFGATFYIFVVTGSELGFGPTRLLGGLAFSMGLVLIVVGGAELFTGNALITMAWADRKVSTPQLLANWFLVYLGNMAGAVMAAFAVHWSGVLAMANGDVASTAISIARAKVTLPYDQALMRGVLCNVLVCLAVWLCFAARTVPGKVFAIALPIAAFVTLGFEHSVANMFSIPLGMLAGADDVTVAGLIHNLVPVTVGNVIGGGGLVALVYWLIYLRPDSGR